MKRLLVISSAGAEPRGDRLWIDTKFLEGMRFYCHAWRGPVSCILHKTEAPIPFGQTVDPADLPFTLRVIDPSVTLGRDEIAGQDVVLCSGDNHRHLGLAWLGRETGTRVVFIIEYILETRMQVIALEPGQNWLRKTYARSWTLRHEIRRRHAFRAAAGLQANGYPAETSYRPINPNTLLYLDNRVAAAQMATPEEMAARTARLRGGGPLRIVHSGRLEPMKGAQDLVSVARALRDRGVDFRLDIFGTGRLEPAIRSGIAAAGLEDRVVLNGVADFATELVPFMRREADLFLSCHRQSDPSCSYLESLSCGVAIAGYANRMWQALAERSGGGWVAPLGDPAALADILTRIAADRDALAARCAAARRFAGEHSFDREFARRIAHLEAAVVA